MIFSSLLFVFGFLPVVLAVYYLLKPLPIVIRNGWLLLASLFFYGWGEPRFVLIMMASILLNYCFGIGIGVSRRKRKSVSIFLLSTAVALNLALLFVFKYLNFSISTIDRIFKDLIPQTEIALPIGISFFTFQAISYLVDVYRGESREQRNPMDVGLYIAFFPQLIAGPIVRYGTIAEQIHGRNESAALFAEGIERFIRGFSKKVILANPCGVMVDEIYAQIIPGTPINGSLAWIGALAYAMQIFFDFSGYSDMAIGLGKMFGFTFEENFDYPYMASTVTDFWRRWHISLSRWFRDYVYIPLGGSHRGLGRQLLNLFIVWSLTGLWHGANWTFLFWGLWYFLFLSAEKICKLPQKLGRANVLIKGAYRFFTLLVVLFSWVFFRAPSLTRALLYIRCMLGISGTHFWDAAAVQYLHENWIILVIAVLLCTPIIRKIKELINKTKWIKKTPVFIRNGASVLAMGVYAVLFLYSISFLVLNFYNPFIYFNF